MKSLATRVATIGVPMGFGGAAIQFSEMPWGIAALIAFGAFIVALTYAVMPQESCDRLSWWQSRWARLDKKDGLPRPAAPETANDVRVDRQGQQPGDDQANTAA